MTRPPLKSLFTNWQQIYLRTSKYIQVIGQFGQDIEIFCAPASGKRSRSRRELHREIGNDLAVIMSSEMARVPALSRAG
jgi:hypothetical protein